jgi:hypothetical protein
MRLQKRSRGEIAMFKETKMVETIDEFCDENRISRSLLYKMIREGRGPRLMKVGRRTLITHEAAEDWRRQMEAASSMGRAA